MQQITKVVNFRGTETSSTKEVTVIMNHLLGKGQFGSVYLAYDKKDPSKKFAIKCLDKKKYSSPALQKALKNEVGLMLSMNSDYVVRLIDTQSTASSYYLLMEICNGCDLKTLRDVRGKYLPEKEARVIMQQLVRGLMALKEKKIVHRDLKMDNVMLNFKSFPDFYG